MKKPARSCFSAVATYMILLSLLPSVSNCIEARVNDVSTPIDNTSQEIDLVSFLNSKTYEHDAIFNEALHILESMRSSPSCNRIAATRLVASCQSIGGKADGIDTDNHEALDHVKSLYAARLAICELNGAGASVPPPCLPVTASSSQKKGLFGFSTQSKDQSNTADSMPTELLESCLMSLESRPQWWTSYSNSRQNAVVICQASRIEIEKEELLDLHKSTVENTLKLNRGLREAFRNAATESLKHEAFLQTVNAMRIRLNKELGETESYIRRTATSLLHDIESSVGSVITSMNFALGRVHTESTALERDIRNVTSEAGHLKVVLRTVHEETLARNEKMADTYKRDTETNHELTSAIRSSLESLLGTDVASLSQNVESFDTSLAWLLGRLDLILQHGAHLTERFQNFETTMEESELRAEQLRKSQLLHFEALAAQSQAQESLQTNIKLAQAFLDKATTTAANLQTMIEDAAGKFRGSPTLRNAFGTYLPGTLCAFLLSAIGAQSSRAGIAALFIYTVLSISAKIF